MIDRNKLRNIDWILIGLLLVNSFIGVVFIYSSSHYLPGNYCLKQLFWIAIGLVIIFLFLFVDYHFLVTYSVYIYLFFMLILMGVLLFGKITAGTKSWIKLPFIHFQPSELAKLSLVLILAYVFSRHRRKYLSFGEGITSGTVVFIPVFLIILQPDLGTALTYIPIFLGAIILAGLNKKTIIFLLIIVILLGLLGWNFVFKDYQKERLTSFLSPHQDPLDSGYQIQQSRIAIGSGGFLGKGYMKGTQSQLRFLPARHTDFIFSVIGEEFGFLGVIVTLLFYYLFMRRMFQSLSRSRDRVGVYLIFMVAIMITSQFFINVMMVIGLIPIVGIPVPLLSYGGSSLLTNYIAVSLILNVKMRRFANV